MSKSWEKVIYDRTKCEQIMNKIEQIMNKIWINYEWKCERKWILMWVWVNLSGFWRKFSENLIKIIDRKWQKCLKVT